MAIHEYQCGLCERVYEELIIGRIVPEIIMCPECGGFAGKIMSVPAIRTSKKSEKKELEHLLPGEGYSELMLGE